MIYAVVAAMRSGTSAFMSALGEGGLPIARSDKRDGFRDSKRDGAYVMNPGSLNELTAKEMNTDSAFPAMYDGHAIKFVVPFLPYMRSHWIRVGEDLFSPGYHAVLIIRNPEEVRQSQAAAIPSHKFQPILPRERAFAWWKGYAERMRSVRKYLENRHDVKSLHVFGHRPVIKDPLLHFKILADAGWPIDPVRAASVIDIKHYRYRYEKLTVGL